jgi:hypothetical protein
MRVSVCNLTSGGERKGSAADRLFWAHHSILLADRGFFGVPACFLCSPRSNQSCFAYPDSTSRGSRVALRLVALHLFALWGWTHIEKSRLLVSKLSVWNGMICSLCYRFSLTAHIRIRSIVRRHNFKSTHWLWPITHYQLYLHGTS